MFNRAELKSNAKEILRKNNTYWISFAVCLIVSLISQGVALVFSDFDTSFSSGIITNINNEQLFQYMSLFAPFIIGFFVMRIAIDIFLFLPLSAGQKRFFIKSAQGDNSFGGVFEVFKREHYLNVVKIMFFKYLYLFLWFMLYILVYSGILALIFYFKLHTILSFLCFFALIPVIIKYYSYFFIEYIVAENPQISKKAAFEQSCNMIREYRFKTFKLQLSFFGWLFLGALACGIGILFVLPYMEATMTQLYFYLKNKDNNYNFCYE